MILQYALHARGLPERRCRCRERARVTLDPSQQPPADNSWGRKLSKLKVAECPAVLDGLATKQRAREGKTNERVE